MSDVASIPDRNLSNYWLRCILEEVLASGAQDAIVSPGGRSIAFIILLKRHAGLRQVISHTDERSLGFIALGQAHATGRPVVICTTSGSAVANLVPALSEAYALRVPLIVLTCDRPRQWRNAGHGQMTDHMGICQAFAAASVDLPDPQDSEDALISLREQVSAVVAHAVNPEIRGIVHINIPLPGEFDSTEIDPAWSMPAVSRLAAFGRSDHEQKHYLPMLPYNFCLPRRSSVNDIIEKLGLRPGLRGLIVAGPECSLSNEEMNRFSLAVGFPVLADAASGLRRPHVANLVAGFDTLAIHNNALTSPQLIIRLGLEPVLDIVQRYLLKNPCPSILIANHVIEQDYLHASFEMLVRPDRHELSLLAEHLGPGDANWLAQWQRTDAEARRLRKNTMAELPWGEVRAVDIICNSHGFDFIHYANSMSVRSGDMFTEPSAISQAVFSNRGVNGIDGTLGSFLGELLGTKQSGLLLIGDLAFIHDLPALAFAELQRVHGCICVINNAGGAIFDFIPASGLPEYKHAIRNTSTINIEAAAKCFGLPYHLTVTAGDLAVALQQCSESSGLHVIEVHVPSTSLLEDNIKIFRSMGKAIAR